MQSKAHLQTRLLVAHLGRWLLGTLRESTQFYAEVVAVDDLHS
jgi:hypothetical protein